jgi:predicted CXXCH cytochrome family protein
MEKQEPMCNKCHEKIAKARINHPFGEKYQDPWHGGTLHCTSCHGPHGTEHEAFTLLPKDGFCLKCHGEKIKESDYFSVHLKIEPRNEPKDKTIDTKVPPRSTNRTEVINKKADT